MRVQIVNPVRQVCGAAALIVTLMSQNAAISAEKLDSSSMVCAERETLLMTLVEAYGAAPNYASDKLSAEAVPLMQARTSCENGHASDAVALYDRLIADLTRSMGLGKK